MTFPQSRVETSCQWGHDVIELNCRTCPTRTSRSSSAMGSSPLFARSPLRTSELAEVAGVTVRALRHYHQIGLLAEPPRSAGGYRRYDVGHLVRLLRITGVDRPRRPAVRDTGRAEQLLDELDREPLPRSTGLPPGGEHHRPAHGEEAA
ncbi:MerR family transcriptional regulator [Amycolatopsis magusensis]|uniref:MerR family transcriptional regulator n=1 Tax=Amycolatopsis magusensis TaxID=882444 RepID=UPI00378DED9D